MSTSPNKNPLRPLNIDLPALAAGMQAALAALAALIESNNAAQAEPSARDIPNGTGDTPGEPGQTRCYQLSPGALEDEDELLRHIGADDPFDCIWRVLHRLSITVSLMERTDSLDGLPDTFIQELGEHLREYLNMLERVAGFLTEMELVHIRSIE